MCRLKRIVTLPHALTIADKGWERALSEDRALGRGLNMAKGKVMHRAVAASLGLVYEGN